MSNGTFNKSDVKLAKKKSFNVGVILGSVATIISGIFVKKITGANIIDKTGEAVDKGIDKVKYYILSKKAEKLEKEESAASEE